MVGARSAGAIGLALILFAACGFGSDQVSGRIGQPVAAGDYELTVTKMENPAERPDRFTNPKPGNRFVKFEVTVGNVGSQHLPVAAGHFTLRDTGGIDNPAMPGIPSDTGLRQDSLSPGRRIQTVMFFEMAANQQPAQLVFAPAVVGWRTRIAVDLGS